MNIEELNILSFGKFKNKKMKLSNGLNIIYGENEAGKSTIHKFIEAMLFSFFKTYTKTKRYNDQYDKYFPWNENQYRGSLKYSYKGETFNIERNFIKGNDEVKIFDDKTGEDISNMYEYNPITRLIEPASLHFGINKSIYMNTVSIPQLKSQTDESFSKEVKDKLINMGGSLDDDISIKKVIERLEKRIDDIGTKNRLKTSPYGKIVEEINNLNIKRNKAYKIFDDTKKFQEDLKKQKNIFNNFLKKKEKLEEDIYKYKCKELNEKHSKVKKLLEEVDKLHKQSYVFKRFKDIKIEDYGEIIKHENSINSIKENIEIIKNSLIEINKKMDLINDHLEEIKLRYNEKGDYKRQLKENQKLKKSITINKILVFLFSFFFIGGLIIAYLFSDIYYLTSIIFFIFNIYFLLRVKNKKSTINDNENLIKSLEMEIKSKEDELRETERFLQSQKLEKNTEIERLKTKLNAENLGIKLILNKYKFENSHDLKEGIEKRKRYEDIIKEINYKREILSSILMNKTFEELEEEVKACSQMNIDNIDLNDENSLEELKSLNDTIRKKDKEISSLEQKIETMHSLFPPIQEIDEDISIKEQEALEYENQLKSIDIAKNTIESISKNIHREFAPKLNENVSNIISEITNEKYKNIKITENLGLKVVGEDNNLIDMDSLSYGTIDQIYFSLRFGIIDIIKNNKKIPLILDDCFIQYDDNRLNSILDFIYNESKKRQIILFTCQMREKQILKNKNYEFKYIEI
ncbi:ATP-binding protein [Senegalia sp. (in: firmicutes)]|uniref:ATP-binding protein n=1 Tax=Senegalia sp. (in: firmicutes) TaxID=1924098 RepID=UPI003F9D34FE